MTGPRPTLSSSASGRMAAMAAAFTSPRVSSVRGRVTTTASAEAMKSCNCDRSNARSTNGLLMVLRLATCARMPKALARAASVWPMWPKPSTPRVCEPSSVRSASGRPAQNVQRCWRRSASARASGTCRCSSAAITYSAIAFSCPKQLHSALPAGSSRVSMASVPAAGAWYRRSCRSAGMRVSSWMPTTTSALAKCSASPGWSSASLRSSKVCCASISRSKPWRKLAAFWP